VDRRQFCTQACQIVSIATMGSLFQGCGGSSTSPDSAPLLPVINAGVVSGVVTFAVDASSPLASVGGAALVQASTGNFLVSRTAQDAFTALTAICTHEGCTVNGFQSPSYVCNCHGSKYSTSGSVVQGPATSPLRAFTARFSNNVLTIS
jgi:nitrite reductase/ring-hydroxylating ferredoxin subunit